MKSERTRGWLNFAAVALALLGVFAGYASLNVRSSPSPTTQNFGAVGPPLRSAEGVLLVTAVAAPVVSLVLAAIGRAPFGALAGIGALVFGTIVLPGFRPACCGSGELSVIGLLRGINNSQQAYSSSCAEGRFASTLETLATPPVGQGTAFISKEATQGIWYGYKVTMRIPEGATVEDAVACNGRAQLASSYFVEAHSIDAVPGRRNFATDERGTIYSNRDGSVIEPGMAGAQPVE